MASKQISIKCEAHVQEKKGELRRLSDVLGRVIRTAKKSNVEKACTDSIMFSVFLAGTLFCSIGYIYESYCIGYDIANEAFETVTGTGEIYRTRKASRYRVSMATTNMLLTDAEGNEYKLENAELIDNYTEGDEITVTFGEKSNIIVDYLIN